MIHSIRGGLVTQGDQQETQTGFVKKQEASNLRDELLGEVYGRPGGNRCRLWAICEQGLTLLDLFNSVIS